MVVKKRKIKIVRGGYMEQRTVAVFETSDLIEEFSKEFPEMIIHDFTPKKLNDDWHISYFKEENLDRSTAKAIVFGTGLKINDGMLLEFIDCVCLARIIDIKEINEKENMVKIEMVSRYDFTGTINFNKNVHA